MTCIQYLLNYISTKFCSFSGLGGAIFEMFKTLTYRRIEDGRTMTTLVLNENSSGNRNNNKKKHYQSLFFIR